MLKVTALNNCSVYDEFFDNYNIVVKEDELYYAHLVNDNQYYYIYDFKFANFIGVYPTDYFGPYELYIAKQRDIKIDEILKEI